MSQTSVRKLSEHHLTALIVVLGSRVRIFLCIRYVAVNLHDSLESDNCNAACCVNRTCTYWKYNSGKYV